MNRRDFLRSSGIILAAPAIVRADSLMRVRPVDVMPYVSLPPVRSYVSIAARDADAHNVASGEYVYVSGCGDNYGQWYVYSTYSGPNVYGHHFHELPA